MPNRSASTSSRSGSIKRIVVPLDGSTEAEAVIPYVRRIAAATRAKVILFSAVYIPNTWMEYIAQVDLDKEMEATRGYLEATGQSFVGVDTEAEVAEGAPAKAILNLAEATGADLIAMTTHGRSGVSRLAWGSVADKVLHSAQTPLLVVRSPEGGAPVAPGFPIEKILVPLDGSELSQSVLPFAQALARDLGSSLLLMHAVASPWAGEPGTFVPTLHDRTLRESIDAAKHMVDRIATGIEKTTGLTVARTVNIGDAVQQIVRVVETETIGLIAMSTHGRTGIGRWMIGSVADAVVRRTHVPSLLVRPQPASGE